MLRLRDRRWAGRGGLRSLLEEVRDSGWCRRSLYRSPPRVASEPGLDRAFDGAVALARRWGTGLALFAGDARALAVAPPFPLKGDADYEGPWVRPLLDLLASEPTVAVVLLRLGRYAVGLLEGGRLAASKTGGRYVHGRHKAGGQSQRRFQRGREHQARRLYQEACDTARAVLAPAEGRIDWVLLGGAEETLRAFLERCAYLRGYGRRLLGRRLEVGRPGLRALEEAMAQVWRSRVLEYGPGDAPP